MQPRTRYLSRLIGLSMIAVSAALMADKQASMAMLMELVYSTPALFLAGMMAVVAGLALVLGHNVWRGGAAAVVVTLVGWWMLAKGLLVLFLPPAWIAHLVLDRMALYRMFYVYPTVAILVGLYLIDASRGKKGGAQAS